MRIIISPAKKMRVDTDSLPWMALPRFLPETEVLLAALCAMDYDMLKALWRCNDSIARLNEGRLGQMNLTKGLTPAILAYEGLQYQYMAPGVLTEKQLAYLSAHLRILSGFYGILHPFDGVTPYRLEMQAKLFTPYGKDLYAFWADRLAKDLSVDNDLLVDLASKEYSRAVLPHLHKSVRVLSCRFGERKDGKLLEKGTACKIARGEMVRFMAECQVERAEDLQQFNRLGYRFAPALSCPRSYIFVKEHTQPISLSALKA